MFLESTTGLLLITDRRLVAHTEGHFLVLIQLLGFWLSGNGAGEAERG